MHLTPVERQELAKRLSPHDLSHADAATTTNLVSGTADNACRAADVAFGQPAVDDLLASESLKFIQLTSAGYTRYDRDDLRAALRSRDAALCTSSGVYDDPCAQHVMSFILGHNRRLLDAYADQTTTRSWRYKLLRPAVRTLGDEKVLIIGFGAIGRRLVELLHPFHAQVRGVRRSPSGDEPIEVVSMAELDEQLPWADHVVNLLPSSSANTRLFDAPRFARMKRGAAFYNVGRGDTVDQAALEHALRDGQISGAYLDVTHPEPLPADHPLWQAPRCLITPHVAGGTQKEMQKLLDHFVTNFERFIQANPLSNRVM